MNHRLAEVTTGKFVGPYVERVPVSELAEDFLRDYRINSKSSYPDAEARWRLHLKAFVGTLLLIDELDKVDDGFEAQAFKRAASCFGLGRYLYNFAEIWCP